MKRILCTLCLVLLLTLQDAWGQRSDEINSGATTVAERQAAWRQHVELERTSPFKRLKWRALGPTRQGGRIEAIACPPGYGTTIYLGVGSGNLWKTTNNGITWTPIFENESTFTIGDVAVSASEPNIVWVGTGETQPRHSGYSYAGTGVFKSVDAGATWTHMGLADTHHIGKVLIHPTNPDIVYVAAIGHFWTDNAERGLFRTLDGGCTWKAVLAVNDQTGVVDVVMDVEDSDTLYASAWQRTRFDVAGIHSGIYKSTDAGDSWRRLEGGLPKDVPLGRSNLAVCPSNPGVVYVFVDNHAPSDADQKIVGGQVYRSDDRGRTWQRTHGSDLHHVFGHYGWKFADIHVSPDDENDLFIMGTRMYHSTDGGWTFDRISEKIVRLHDHKAAGMHLDHHDLWIDPLNPDRLLLGNDGGLFMSYDRGETWLHVNNLPIGEYYTIAVDMGTPYNIYGGTQDNASHMGPATAKLEETRPDQWQQIFLDRWGGGDGFVTLPDPTDRRYIYYEHQHGDIYRKKLAGSVLTGAAEDSHIRPKTPAGSLRYRFGWHTPFVISHHDPFTLYVGGNKLLKSTNRGEEWIEISPEFAADPGQGNRGIAPLGVVSTLSESCLKSGLIYIGLDNGQIHVTQDDGETWKQLDAGLPDKWVSRVVASQHDPGAVYVSFTGYREDDFDKYLYASTDCGQNWSSITTNLPSESINVVREDPRDKNILYVGTDLGVYITLDRGALWHSLCSNLPTTPVHDMVVHPRDHELVIGTHGRSVFVLDVRSIVSTPKE